MRIPEATIGYLAEKSGIPVWIVRGDGELVRGGYRAEFLGERERMQAFFAGIAAQSDALPQVKKVPSGELYASFALGEGDFLVAGPSYELHPMLGGKRGSAGVLFSPDHVKEVLLQMPTVSAAEFCRYTCVLAEVLLQRQFEPGELERDIRTYYFSDALNRQLAETLFDIREEERETAYAPDAEKRVLSYVTNGDVDALKNFRMPRVKDPNAEGNRSQDLFECVALVTLATRAAIAGGLDYVVAFSLSDLYLQRLGLVSSRAELSGIVSQVLSHFARKVKESQELQKKKVSSPYIRQGIQYIRSHLHGRVTLEDAAQAVGLDPKYFSRLFVTVTGERFSTYVQRERIQEAKDLLAHSNRTIIDVSNSLGFSSQSYFIKVFTEFVGETPGEYLKKHRRPRG